MARSRNIKPGFFRNEYLVELPYETRLLFIGLWTIADREGRLEDRPKRIKMELFPADNLDVDACLQQLNDAGFILRYGVGDARYIQVIAFGKHQNPHHKEQASTIPAPDEINSTEHKTETSPGYASGIPHASRADSLNTDSLNTDSLNPAPKRTRKRGELSERQRQLFDRWYAEYPRKVDKAGAVKAWGNITPEPDDALVGSMVAKVREWAKSHEWTKDSGQFIPYPATWLNGARWTDDAPVPVNSLSIVGGTNPYAGRGYDPMKSMTPDEKAIYDRQLEQAKARAEELERERGVG